MTKQGPGEHLQLIKDFLGEIANKVNNFFQEEPGKSREGHSSEMRFLASAPD